MGPLLGSLRAFPGMLRGIFASGFSGAGHSRGTFSSRDNLRRSIIQQPAPKVGNNIRITKYTENLAKRKPNTLKQPKKDRLTSQTLHAKALKP